MLLNVADGLVLSFEDIFRYFFNEEETIPYEIYPDRQNYILYFQVKVAGKVQISDK